MKLERRLTSRPVSTLGTLIVPNRTQQEGPPIVTEGLVGHWDFADPRSYVGTGTTINNLAGDFLHCTLSNNPLFTNPNLPVVDPLFTREAFGSLLTDGTDDTVTTPYDNKIAFLNRAPFSVETSFRVTATPGVGFPFLVRRHNGNSSLGEVGGWMLHTRRDNPLFRFGRAIPGNANQLDVSIASSEYVGGPWHHLCGTYDGTTMRLYINGIERGSRSSTINLSQTTVELRLIDFGFLGLTSRVLIYDRALSGSEVYQNYSSIRWRFGI